MTDRSLMQKKFQIQNAAAKSRITTTTTATYIWIYTAYNNIIEQIQRTSFKYKYNTHPLHLH